MIKRLPLLAGLVLLGACGSSGEPRSESGQAVADKLENAADQSGPAAQQVLETAAAQARQQPAMAPVDEPGSFAQEAMRKAGEAEARALPSDKAGAGTPAR